jgi:hypothetical protein
MRVKMMILEAIAIAGIFAMILCLEQGIEWIWDRLIKQK